MKKIYADESGCLGFNFEKSGTSKFIIITFLILKECRPITSLVKKVIKTLPKSRIKKGTYLHAHNEKPITRERLLRGLASKDIEIATIRLDKRTLLVSGGPNELYTSMVVSLINRLYADGVIKETDNINLVASLRNTSKKLNDDFSSNILGSTKKVKFNISIVMASVNKCLQAVDFVSWALWQKYENGDETYSDIITDKIVKEYVMHK